MDVPSFRIAARAREVSASPSVSLEKGRHRIRAPRIPNLSDNSSLPASRHSQPSADRNNLYLSVLVLLLVFASLASFGAAYYLYKFRWSLPFELDPHRADEIAQVIGVDPGIEACPQMNGSHSHEKYLSYLPHSGFNNQRIALENALTLSRLLNRTLLIPPVRLGTKPLRYVNYDSLYSFIALSGKDNLGHCSKTPLNIPLPSECFDYFDYTLLSWEWLVDFASIRARQPTIFRWSLTDTWIHECLDILPADTRVLKDSSRYHFRFVDDGSVSQNEKYSEDLKINELASYSEPLLQIGTLFGSSRLHLAVPENHRIRSQIRESMALANPVLLQAVELIAQSLGDSYLGVHVRLGDGQFKANGENRSRLAWLSLVQEVIGLSTEDALTLEQSVGNRGRIDGNQEYFLRDTHLRCRRPGHTQSRFMSLNVPLYIATDAKEPFADPSLELFFSTFPCAFHLGDFTGHLAALDRLENLYDGLKLKSFLLPFVDAMVAGKARRAVGTAGSTFSTYVTDVLWSKYHDYEISERG